MPHPSRLPQFELLRIMAMLGVVINHVFNYGMDIYGDFTVDVSSSPGEMVGGFGITLWSLLELMKLMVLVSVNCYILISGYFLIDRCQWRWRGIWQVWSTTWVYSVGIFLIATIVLPLGGVSGGLVLPLGGDEGGFSITPPPSTTTSSGLSPPISR